MLICPVTEKGAKSRTLYLPEGTWIDYWSGEKITGKQNIITKTPLEKLPIYVKAGAIIPMQPDMQYFGEKPLDPITLDIYPFGNSSASLYEDDGLTLEYQKGKYAITEITCAEDSQKVKIEIHESKGEYKVTDRNYTLLVHLDKKPELVLSAEIVLNDWKWDTEKNLLEVTVFKNANEKFRVLITK
jgi:alpha-glucosidase (family GH31 glycosyl hydrolase)